MDKLEEDWNRLSCAFWKLVSLTVFQSSFLFLLCLILCLGGIFFWLEAMILPFTINFSSSVARKDPQLALLTKWTRQTWQSPFNNNRKLKQRQQWWQEEWQKSNSFILSKTTTLHDYNLKVHNFTFCWGREHKIRTLFFLSWTFIQSFRIQLQKICQHLTN